MRECLNFVHLSDIHFTGKSGNSCFDLDSDVRHELQRDAAALVQRVGLVNGVLVTGDIAFSGARDEYAKAGAWLVGFSGAIKCAEERRFGSCRATFVRPRRARPCGGLPCSHGSRGGATGP